MPRVGHSRAPATASRVDLPDPLGPSTTQRSPGRHHQVDVVEDRAAVADHGHALQADSWVVGQDGNLRASRPSRPEQHCAQVRSPASHSHSSRR